MIMMKAEMIQVLPILNWIQVRLVKAGGNLKLSNRRFFVTWPSPGRMLEWP
jgi:hypothetical protein